MHYSFLKSEKSARSSSDSFNGSDISVDLLGFLTQARHINRMIYVATTMISKIVPTQVALCRTKMQLAYNNSYFDSYKEQTNFLLWLCRSDCRKNASQTLVYHKLWVHIVGIWGGGGNGAQIMHLCSFHFLKTFKILLQSIPPNYSKCLWMHNSANTVGVGLK